MLQPRPLRVPLIFVLLLLQLPARPPLLPMQRHVLRIIIRLLRLRPLSLVMLQKHGMNYTPHIIANAAAGRGRTTTTTTPTTNNPYSWSI